MIEPLPNPVVTASELRELTERTAARPTRRERRTQRKLEQRQAIEARKQAERARADAAKAAKAQAKAAKKASRRGETPPAPAIRPEDIELPEAPAKLGWRERKELKLLDTIGAVEGEEVALLLDGRSRVRAATLIVTTYRVAIVSRGARRRTIGWIPLEEIERVRRVWRGAETLHVEGSFERLSFQAAAAGALKQASRTVKAAVKEGRASGTARHHADVIQAWCERTAEVWESDANRIRLWIRKHPASTLAALSSLVPAAYLLSSRL